MLSKKVATVHSAAKTANNEANIARGQLSLSGERLAETLCQTRSRAEAAGLAEARYSFGGQSGRNRVAKGASADLLTNGVAD